MKTAQRLASSMNTNPATGNRIAIVFFLLISLCLGCLTSYSQCPKAAGTEAIKDGGFENGGDPSNSYGPHAKYVPGPGTYSNPGFYYIGNDVNVFNFGLPGKNVKPRTGTKMLMVDASTQIDPVFFQQTVNILPNQLYFFSCWITSLADLERCNLQFRVKGENDANWTVLGPSVAAPDVGVWQQVYESWSSGTNTKATIQMVNIHPPDYGWAGNDYAIDDISFINTCPTINDGPKPDFGASTLSLCNTGGTVDLKTNVAAVSPNNFTWFKDNVVQPLKTSNEWNNVTQTGKYVVCVESNTCVNSDTVDIVASLFLDLGPDSKLCSPSTRKLSTGITANNNFQIVWKKDGVVVPDSTGPSFTVSGPGTYRVEVTDLAGGNCNGSDEVLITSDLPVPNNFTFCPTTNPNQTFSVIGSGKYKWWDAASGGNVIGKGSSYNATGLTGTTIFYVEDTTTIPSPAGPKNDASWSIGDKNPNNVADQNFLRFRAKKNATIDDISVKIRFYNNNVASGGTATLTDKTNGTVQTKSFSVTYPGNGDFTVVVPLGFNIIAGHDYDITIFGNNAWGGTLRYYDPSGTYINYANFDYEAVKFTQGQDTHAFEGLFDWHLSLPSECARMPVVATAECTVNCSNPVDPVLTPAGPFNLCEGTPLNTQLTASISNPADAAFEYEFFNAGVSVQGPSTTNTYTVTQAGSYTVKITDPAGPGKCKATSSAVSFTINPNPTLSHTKKDACAGQSNGSIDLTVNNGTAGSYTYSWDTSPASASEDLNNIPSGKYSVTVTDGNNCNATTTVTINPITVTVTPASTDISCAGAADGQITISASGGSTPYSYSIDGNTYGSSNAYNGLAAGNYTAYVKDNNNCIVSVPLTITEPPVITITTTTIDVLCYGDANGSFSISAAGGTAPYSYSKDGTTYGNSDTFNNLSAGSYTAYVQDSKGCKSNIPVSINATQAATLTVVTTDALCKGDPNGSLTINANGGNAPYTYSLDNTNFSNSNAFNSLQAGNYTVYVKDNSNCLSQKTAVIGEPQALVITTTATDILCNGYSTGSFTITSSGGQTPYSYSKDGTTYGNSNNFGGLTAGNYTAYVKDNNNCVVSKPVTISEPTAISMNVIKTDVLCNGKAEGSFTITAVGGTSPYTYSKDGSTYINTNTFSNLTAGNYTAYVKDNNNCAQNSPVSITEPTVLQGVVSSSSDVSCNGGNDGSFSVTPSGGTPAYTYSLNGGAYGNQASFSNLTAQTYTVNIKDNNGCIFPVLNTINQPSPLSLQVSKTDETCLQKGTITLLAQGGTSPYEYSIDNGNVYVNSGNFSNLNAGSYSIITKDAKLCTSSPQSIVINNQGLFKPQIGGVLEFCEGDSTYLFVKDSSNYQSSSWLPDNETTFKITVKKAQAYTVKVIGQDGCPSDVSDPAVVTEIPTPDGDVGQDSLLVCSGVPITLGTKGSASYAYSWTSVPKGFTSEKANPTLTTPDKPTIYIRATKNGKCTSTDTLQLHLQPEAYIYVPNAFTPNDDKLNDVFLVESGSITSFSCNIYNRWGEMIYQWNDISQGWDGTCMNKQVQSDIYVYYITAQPVCGNKSINRNGTVTIIR